MKGLVCIFLLFASVLVLSSCQPSPHERGLSLAQMYIDIPQQVSHIEAYHIGEGQYDAIYIKFEISTENADEFLATICVAYLELSEETNPFAIQDTSGLPDWWDINDGNFSRGGECSEGNVLYQVVISEHGELTLIYIRLNIP